MSAVEAGQKRRGGGTPYEVLHVGNKRALVRYENGDETGRLVHSVAQDELLSPLPLPDGWTTEGSIERGDFAHFTDTDGDRLSAWCSRVAPGCVGLMVTETSAGKSATVYVPIASLRELLDLMSEAASEV